MSAAEFDKPCTFLYLQSTLIIIIPLLKVLYFAAVSQGKLLHL